MMVKDNMKLARSRRVKKALSGAKRNRLIIRISNRYIYAQITDLDGKVIVSSSSKTSKKTATNKSIQSANVLAKSLAEKLKNLKIEELVLNRGSRLYHGRIKTIADILREEGFRL